MQINLTHLYQFYITAKEGSIKKASKFLHITEPTISKQIKELEIFLRINLFKRINNHLQLTLLGEELMNRSELVFQSIEDIEFLFKKKELGISNKLTIAAPALVYPYLPRFFDMDLCLSDFITLELSCFRNEDLKENLDTKALDIALTDKPCSLDDYYCKKIIDLPLCVIIKDKKEEAFDFSKAQEYLGMIALSSSYRVEEEIKQYFFANKMSTPKKVILDSFEACKEEAMRGFGAAIVPKFLIKEEIENGQLKVLSELPKINFSIWLVCLKSRTHEPLINYAVAHVSEQSLEELFQLRS